jgi:hypothetical protein
MAKIGNVICGGAQKVMWFPSIECRSVRFRGLDEADDRAKGALK